MQRREFMQLGALTAFGLSPTATIAAAEADLNSGLLARWPLAGDPRDHSGHNHHGRKHAADLTSAGPGGKLPGAAAFDGRGAFIEVPDASSLHLGTGDFSITAWVHTDKSLDDVLGDILCKYDPNLRKGF